MNRYRIWLPSIILIALALRLYQLTYHSLWFDEAISVHWARQTVPRILEVGFTQAEDRLPPLYYLMLKGWTILFGRSEIGVRSLSVAFGTLLIPVVASLAAALFNRRVALGAALLTALNPFLIWYAQEARMYAPAVFFSALTVWAFVGLCNASKPTIIEKPNQAQARTQSAGRTVQYAIQHQSILYLTGFILAAIAGLYTHLYTGFLLPALGLWLVISYPWARRLWLLFAASGLIITLTFVPLAMATWRFAGEAPPGDPVSGIGQRAWWLLQAFTVWKAPLSPITRIVIPAITALAAVVAYLRPKALRTKTQRADFHSGDFALRSTPDEAQDKSQRTTVQNPLLLITLLIITPFAVANLLLWRNHLAFFGERYFIVMVPWLLLLVAAGVDNLGRWLQPSRLLHYLPLILVLIILTLPIPGQWSIPASKEAWRQSAAYLANTATPADGILIHPDWVRYPFQFYFEGPGQTYAAFSDVTAETTLDGPLEGVVKDHAVIWLIQSHLDGPDPDRRVEQWFASRYPLATELYPPGIALKGFVTRYQLDTLPPEAKPADIQFENGLHLIGYQSDQVVTARDDLFHPPSGWVHVILYWTAAGSIMAEANPIVQIVGPEGVWGVDLTRSNDVLKFYLPSHWPAMSDRRTIIRHDMDVNLNPATLPGTYELLLGME
ncbi:MAG TPA: glycosyltransferase family 39 protein, partial [Anaerolineae bacterium]